ncbi:isochorismatase family protein [Candidatus Gracilibacteria bacterium]|nr:isochorismatase family protein [Candidatus Gracilibacteria bacterium]
MRSKTSALEAKKEALLLVDCQKDFGAKEGSLYVKKAEAIVPVINKLIAETKANAGIVIASRDWHPENHTSFSNWPNHCVINTPGVEYMDGLNVEEIEVEVKKGFRVDADSYSAFGGQEFKNDIPRKNLLEILTNYKVEVLKIVGLATDYCVKATVIDAAKLNFEVLVVRDGIKAVNINPEDEQNAIDEMMKNGAKFI